MYQLKTALRALEREVGALIKEKGSPGAQQGGEEVMDEKASEEEINQALSNAALDEAIAPYASELRSLFGLYSQVGPFVLC